MDRRDAVRNISLASVTPLLAGITIPEVSTVQRNFHHSVCRWCYNDTPLEELCDRAKDAGVESVELLSPADWKTAQQRGLQIALSNGSPLGITKGFNDPKNHTQLQQDIINLIPRAASEGVEKIIVFSGNRNGISDETGLEHCAAGLAPLIKWAEQFNIMLVMELLNSKIDHKDYQCDHTAWGVRLVEKIGSPHFKLLYDIYHMQIMEGDVIRTIRDHHAYIAHYHTAGVPGRHEIDHTQELNYPAIMRAIADTGFDGYVAQEFIPKASDPFASLQESIRICSV